MIEFITAYLAATVYFVGGIIQHMPGGDLAIMALNVASLAIIAAVAFTVHYPWAAVAIVAAVVIHRRKRAQ